MRRFTTALSITTLALSLAACGQMPSAPSGSTPGTVSGQMVKIRLGATAPALAKNGLGAQGLPAGAPLATIKVTVRDAQNNPVYFVNGTYSPRSDVEGATSTVVLDESTDWSKTVLLPKGQYSFENAGKFENGTQNVLLSYGPASENTRTISEENSVVQLRFHGVIDPMKSRLDFAMQTNAVYTNDEVHLKLYANTADVDGKSFPLPLSDIFMGSMLLSLPENYTLADWNSAEFMGPGSARGVDLIARGTVGNPNLKVNAHFRAYVRQGTSDVATLQPVELPAFEHAIEMQTIVADVERPYEVTMGAIESATPGQMVNLSGVARDRQGVTRIDVYEGSTLVASTAPDEAPGTVTTDEGGHWSVTWVARAGTHELTVVARDAAGNESEASQTVTVGAKAQHGDLYYNPWMGSYVQNVTVHPGESQWIEVDLSQSPRYEAYYFRAYDNGFDEVINPITFQVFETPEGSELPYTYWNFDNEWESFRSVLTEGRGTTFWVKITNTGSADWTYNFDAGTFYD